MNSCPQRTFSAFNNMWQWKKEHRSLPSPVLKRNFIFLERIRKPRGRLGEHRPRASTVQEHYRALHCHVSLALHRQCLKEESGLSAKDTALNGQGDHWEPERFSFKPPLASGRVVHSDAHFPKGMRGDTFRETSSKTAQSPQKKKQNPTQKTTT